MLLAPNEQCKKGYVSSTCGFSLPGSTSYIKKRLLEQKGKTWRIGSFDYKDTISFLN